MPSFGTHSIQRANVAAKATKAYKEAIDTYLREGMQSVAYLVINSAFHFRCYSRNPHNFTGNLLNSICAGVFYKGELVYKRFVSDIPGVGRPIQVEMTASKGGKLRQYHFVQDYEGEEDTDYTPTVVTAETYGNVLANAFIDSYHPTSNYLEVVLAYTAEYAEYVDTVGNLGFENTFQEFNKILMVFQEKAKKGERFGNGHVLKYVNVTK